MSKEAKPPPSRFMEAWQLHGPSGKPKPNPQRAVISAQPVGPLSQKQKEVHRGWGQAGGNTEWLRHAGSQTEMDMPHELAVPPLSVSESGLSDAHTPMWLLH